MEQELEQGQPLLPQEPHIIAIKSKQALVAHPQC